MDKSITEHEHPLILAAFISLRRQAGKTQSMYFKNNLPAQYHLTPCISFFSSGFRAPINMPAETGIRVNMKKNVARL